MKEVANTFKDSEFGNRVGLWTRSKVREGRKEGGGQESRLEAGLISVPTPHLSGFPFSLPLVPLSPITNRSTERSPPRPAPQALNSSSIGSRRNALSCRHFPPSGMEVTGGVLQASLTQDGLNKIHSFSLSLLYSVLAFLCPSAFSGSRSLGSLSRLSSWSPTGFPQAPHGGSRLTSQPWL